MKRCCSMLFWCFSLWMTPSSARSSPNETYVYVSLDSLQKIAIYKIDSLNGDLIFVKGVAVDGQPGSLTVDPTNLFLHAALRTKNSVASFRIDETNGDLKLMSTVNVSWNPVYLSMDRTGKYLFTAYFSDNKAAVYAVGQNGAIQSGALQVLTTASNPHSIQIDKSNRYLFVPCRSGEAIFQYRFDETTGTITSNSPDRWITRDSTGPRHIIFHPFLSTAYVANEFGKSVTAYQVDDAMGTLSEIQTLSMIKETSDALTVTSSSGGADLHITPNGRFLYATNRGTNSLTAFQLEDGTGLMNVIAQYPTEKMPRSFAIDPSGKYLYVAGQRSGTIAVYGIDSAVGTLKALKKYSVGRNPVWIQIVKMEIAK